jgi:hypothetical protein
MKALQSDLARKVLADNLARSQLRLVVSSDHRSRNDELRSTTIVLQDGTTVRRLTATVVPKAA